MIDIRCPRFPVRLLLRIGNPVVTADGANLIEVACKDCRTDRRRAGQKVDLVVHRYNVLGQLVETEVSPACL